MTAKRRLVPIAETREMLDLLQSYGIRLNECAIDIGPDGVKVSPPANSNAGGDSLAQYIGAPPHSPKEAEKR